MRLTADAVHVAGDGCELGGERGDDARGEEVLEGEGGDEERERAGDDEQYPKRDRERKAGGGYPL